MAGKWTAGRDGGTAALWRSAARPVGGDVQDDPTVVGETTLRDVVSDFLHQMDRVVPRAGWTRETCSQAGGTMHEDPPWVGSGLLVDPLAERQTIPIAINACHGTERQLRAGRDAHANDAVQDSSIDNRYRMVLGLGERLRDTGHLR